MKRQFEERGKLIFTRKTQEDAGSGAGEVKQARVSARHMTLQKREREKVNGRYERVERHSARI